MTAPAIAFSLRPLTLKDSALFERVKAGDTQALIDLIVRRSDPPVSAEVVGDLTHDEAATVFQALADSLSSMQQVNGLLLEALGDPKEQAS